MKAAFGQDLNSHMVALEAAGYKLNEKTLQQEVDGEILNPVIAEATCAIDKFVAASKHIKKFIAPSVAIYESFFHIFSP